MTSRLYFRVDANAEIGLGHLSRCLSLAEACVATGASAVFLMIDPPAAIASRIAASGHNLQALPSGIAAGSTADAEFMFNRIELEPSPPTLVVDHYKIDAGWESRLRPVVKTLAVIDDLADRRHECDLLIDQNRMFDAARAYDGFLNPDAKRLMGPRYALLRREFAEMRQKLRIWQGVIRTVFVGFGGADPGGHTLAVMQALGANLEQLEGVDIAIGALNPFRDEITRLAQGRSQFRLHFDATNVAELLLGADLAIGGGGVMSWERVCLAVPSLVFGIVPNQHQNIRDLLRAGAIMGAVDMPEPQLAVISAWLDIALTTPDLLRGLAERGALLVDGLGSQRVASHLVAEPLRFRRAQASDSETMYRWRNHPAIRAVSFNKGEINQADHDRWFEGAQKDENRLLLIAEQKSEAVGVVRFDLSGNKAEISLYKDPDYAGAIDLVKQATHWLFDNRDEVDEIVAIVLAENGRSAQAFESAGYGLRDSRYVTARPIGDTGTTRPA